MNSFTIEHHHKKIVKISMYLGMLWPGYSLDDLFILHQVVSALMWNDQGIVALTCNACIPMEDERMETMESK